MTITHDGVDSPDLRVYLGVGPTTAEDHPQALRLGGTVGLGTGRLGSIEWWNASPDLLSYSLDPEAGREDEAAVSPADLTLRLDNAQGIYDPLPQTTDPGSVVGAGFIVGPSAILRPPTTGVDRLQIDVGSPVRVVASIGGQDEGRYFGYIDSIVPTLSMDPQVTIRCLDGLEVLGRAKLSEVAPQLDRQRSGARVGHILNLAGWPSSRRAIDVGEAELAPYVGNDYALPALQKVTGTELGALFIDGAGVLTFYDRYRVYRRTRSTTVQATISDSGAAGVIEPQSVEVARERPTVFNRVAITREAENAVEQVAEDFASQQKYGTRDYPGSPGALLPDDGAARDMARWLVGRYAWPTDRVSQVVVDGYDQDPAGWAALLALRRHDRIRVVRDYGPSVLDVELWVESIAEEFVPFEAWTFTITTRPADRVRLLVLGGSAGLGSARLGF